MNPEDDMKLIHPKQVPAYQPRHGNETTRCVYINILQQISE